MYNQDEIKTKEIIKMTDLTALKNEEKINRTGRYVRLFMLSVICMLVLAVSFAAFLKIENNVRALLVLTVSMGLNAFVFANGYSQIKRKNNT